MIPQEMKIDVEWQDRVDGETSEPTSCAIVKAIHRLYPAITHINVTRSTIKVSDKRDRLRYVWTTPRIAQAWIDNYDKTKDGEPLIFRLRRDEAEAIPMAMKRPLAVSRPEAADRKARLASETPAERKARETKLALRKLRQRKGVKA